MPIDVTLISVAGPVACCGISSIFSAGRQRDGYPAPSKRLGVLNPPKMPLEARSKRSRNCRVGSTLMVAVCAGLLIFAGYTNAGMSANPVGQSQSGLNADFFRIHSIKFLNRAPRDNVGVWKMELHPRGMYVITDFLDCIEIQVSTLHDIAGNDIFAKAYFFDASGNLLASCDEPSKSGPKSNRKAQYSLPVLFQAGKMERLFFEIPSNLKRSEWKVVVVFGDSDEAKAISYPKGTSYNTLEFPEKQLIGKAPKPKEPRRKVSDGVIEYVAKTRNPKQPQITMFLRPPAGIHEWSEVNGVYALVTLANDVEEIRRRMQAVELTGDEAGTFAFANKHKLAILMWGSRRIWNPRMNFDEYRRQEALELDRSFDLVAKAWEDAVQYFHKEYGIPTKNYFLRGSCGAAQWAKRLCLRKPDYFLAAHIHMAGSYDRPTPEASRVLWCVTTKEQDGGYERSLRFFDAAKAMGYPIVYKAATPGTGIGKLGDEFFEYAMTVIDERVAFDHQRANPLLQSTARTGGPPLPWLRSFANPPFYCDVVNQELLPSDESELIPAAFRSAIPTKALAETWQKSNSE